MAPSDGRDTSEIGQRDPPVRKEADHGIRAIFQQWDHTGQGMIRKDELLLTFSGLGLHMSERELSLMLQSADMSGDESVQYGKFLQWIFASASSSESGHQTDVSSRDVQMELHVSVPDGLGCQVEAEADETEIERCGDILQAAKEGNVRAVRHFLRDPESLARVDDEHGDGPLAIAAFKGHLEVVKVLLAAGASVEAKNQYGWVPLALAVSQGHLEVVEVLLAAGASVAAKNIGGVTLLHVAAIKGEAAVAERLLAAGAPVDAAAKDGWTPLRYAVDRGRAAVVEQLVAAGAAVNAVNGDDGVHGIPP